MNMMMMKKKLSIWQWWVWTRTISTF